MSSLILMGGEAVAQGAIDAGIRGAFAYPGTPSTELFEYIMKNKPDDRSIFTTWSTNEKTAYESALGMSYAGGRCTVSMKHVGLNVAADPFMNSAITGANGGLLVIVADDPGMHSSQNEQDTRFYSAFSQIPCLEPSTQQEAYDMAWMGVQLSEQMELPVLLRLVTRLAHSRAPVQTRERLDQTSMPLLTDAARFILLPANARRNWARLVERTPLVRQMLWEQPFNQLELKGTRLGVITSGVAHNYFLENTVEGGVAADVSFLKIGTYPMPLDLLRQLFDHCDEILVLEDGYPFIEGRLRGELDTPLKPVHGKQDGWLPPTGELDPTVVRHALHIDARQAAAPVQDLARRPPALCVGCPHIETYRIVNQIIEDAGSGRVMGDIGCYTLGALSPYEAIDSCVDMGASVAMTVGVAMAGVHPAIGIVGDSTFAHSGMTGLLDAVRSNINMVLVIVDNGTVAMTGQQESALTGEKLIAAVKGVGIHPDHVRVIHPIGTTYEENLQVVKDEVAYDGPSVVIAYRACIHIPGFKPVSH